MADVSLGEIRGRLTADASQFVQSLQQAIQALAQFQQQMQAQSGQAAQGMQQAAVGAQQLAQQLQLLNQQAISQTGFLAQISAQLRAMHGASQQAAQGVQQVGQAVQHAQPQVESFAQSWRGVLQVAGGVGLATSVQGIVSSIKDFAVSTVEVGTRMEALRNSLSSLSGSSAAGQQQFEQLFQTAQRLGVAFEPLARGFRQLTAAATQAGLPLSEQRRLLEALATEGRRVGSSNEEMGRAITAIAQIASKGKVSMEELRQQLGEAIPTAMAAAARGMGRTTEELEKLIETGAVRFPSFARALTRGFEELQRAGGPAAEGLQQGFNRFGNELVRAKDILLQQLNPALKTVTDTATSFLKILNDSAEAQKQLAAARAAEARIGTGLREGDVARLSAEQQRRLTTLNRLLAEQTLAQGDPNAPPMFQPTREEYIAQLKAERDALYDVARATKAQNDEQVKATAEINKTRANQQLQQDYLTDLRKKLDEVTKAQADFRKEAAVTPALFGRPSGSTEAQVTFAKEQQQRLAKQLEELGQLAARPPTGVTIPQELLQQIRAVDTQYGKLGETIDNLREQEQARRKAAREAEQEAARDAREFERERKERIQDLAKNLDIFGLTLAPEQEAELKEQAREQRERIREFAKTLDIFGLELSPEQERQRRVGAALDTRIEEQMEHVRARLRGTFQEERPEIQLRARFAREGLVPTEAQEAQLRRLTEMRERLQVMQQVGQVVNDLIQGVGSAFSSALTGIADGTRTVSEAFRDMARSILQSMAQIAANQAFQALTKFALGLVSSYFTGGVSAGGVGGGELGLGGAGGGSGFLAGTGGGLRLMQHGGFVNRPTLALLGEAGGGEYVVPQRQMQQLMSSAMRAGPSAGGQAAGLTIINVASKAEAEQTAAQQRAMGREAVINFVLSDMRQGEGSQINRMIRTTAR